MRIAVISDIHANFSALKKVFKDIRQRSIDEIFFLGDLCTLGPDTIETTETLLSKCKINILGNHDEYLFNENAIYSYTNEKIIIDSILYAKNILPKSLISSIQKFPSNLEIDLDYGNKICLYHGSPKCNTDNIYSDIDFDTLNSYFFDYDCNIFIGGHTHIQMYKKYMNNFLINCGSVGQPFCATNRKGPPELLPKCEYSILNLKKKSVTVEFIQLDYDLNTHVKRIMQSDLPLKYWLKSQYNI